MWSRDKGGGESASESKQVRQWCPSPLNLLLPPDTRRRTERAPRTKAKGARGKGWGRGGSSRVSRTSRVISPSSAFAGTSSEAMAPGRRICRERDSEPRWVKSARVLYLTGILAKARSLASLPPGRARCFEEGSARARLPLWRTYETGCPVYPAVYPIHSTSHRPAGFPCRNAHLSLASGLLEKRTGQQKSAAPRWRQAQSCAKEAPHPLFLAGLGAREGRIQRGERRLSRDSASSIPKPTFPAFQPRAPR